MPRQAFNTDNWPKRAWHKTGCPPPLSPDMGKMPGAHIHLGGLPHQRVEETEFFIYDILLIVRTLKIKGRAQINYTWSGYHREVPSAAKTNSI